MEYGRIIKRALEITWRNKVLWVFGIAATLFGAGGGGGGGGSSVSNNIFQYSFNGRDVERWRSSPMPFGPWSDMRPPDVNWEVMGAVIAGLVLLMIAVALLMAIVGIIVRYTSLGAMVGMVAEVEEAERTRFKSGLKTGWGRFLRLFAMDLLLGIGIAIVIGVLVLIGIVVALLVAGVIVFLMESGRSPAVGIILGVVLGLGALLVLFVVSLALSAIVTLVREYAFRDCVLNKRGIFDSLGAGIALLRQKTRESVLMWLLMVGINLALGIVAIPLFVLGMAMTVGPALAVWGASQSAPAAILVGLPFLLGFMVIGAAVGGIYLAFQSAVWTLTFRELRSRDLVRVVA